MSRSDTERLRHTWALMKDLMFIGVTVRSFHDDPVLRVNYPSYGGGRSAYKINAVHEIREVYDDE